MSIATRLAAMATRLGRWRPVKTARRPRAILFVEDLEARNLLATSLVAQPIPTNISNNPIDVNTSEGTIAINPRNPSQLFAAWNVTTGTQHIEGKYSTDGGTNWLPSTLPTNPSPSYDPWATFDAFGNLFFSYIYLGRVW